MSKTTTTSKYTTKPNINLRRKIKIYCDRSILCIKLLFVLFIYLICFTPYLNSVKHWVSGVVYEYTADANFVLENVVILGATNVKTSDIVQALNADVGTPILSIDLEKAKWLLEKNSWIKAVVVSRRLPKTICINIVEHKPIAIWQRDKKLYLVDEEGSVLDCDKIEKFADLLHVVGENANLHASTLLQSLSKEQELLKKISSAVRYGDRRWNLILEQDITVKMPEQKDFNVALEYLSKLLHENKLFDQDYKHIDLRIIDKYFFEKNTGDKQTKN